jgi:hypothetical protein
MNKNNYMDRLEYFIGDYLDETLERSLIDHIGSDSIGKTYTDMAKDQTFNRTYEYFRDQRNFIKQKDEYLQETRKAQVIDPVMDDDDPDMLLKDEEFYFLSEDEDFANETSSFLPNIFFFESSFI